MFPELGCSILRATTAARAHLFFQGLTELQERDDFVSDDFVSTELKQKATVLKAIHPCIGATAKL